MKKLNLIFEKVTIKNLDAAIQIQRDILPEDDGIVNIQISTDKEFIKKYGIDDNKYLDTSTYWLCIDNNEFIGITGLYSYFEYPKDVWLGWFGVLPKFRERGYGKRVLLWTMEKAKELGFENFRLYTDIVYDKEAVNLYRKIGMLEEPYLTEKLKGKTFIFSKNLYSYHTEKFGNKNLFLNEQEELQNIFN